MCEKATKHFKKKREKEKVDDQKCDKTPSELLLVELKCQPKGKRKISDEVKDEIQN